MRTKILALLFTLAMVIAMIPAMTSLMGSVAYASEEKTPMNSGDFELSEILVEGWTVDEMREKLLLYYKNPENNDEYELYDDVKYYFIDENGNLFPDDHVFVTDEKVKIAILVKAPEGRHFRCTINRDGEVDPSSVMPFLFDHIQVKTREYKNGISIVKSGEMFEKAQIGTALSSDGKTVIFDEAAYLQADEAGRSEIEKNLEYLSVTGNIGVTTQWEVFGSGNPSREIPNPKDDGFEQRCKYLYHKYFITEYIEKNIWKITLNQDIVNLKESTEGTHSLFGPEPYKDEDNPDGIRQTVIIDLNGYTIDENWTNRPTDTQGKSTPLGNHEDCTLIIEDSSKLKTGKIIGGNTVTSSAIGNSGILIINGGTIIGNNSIPFEDGRTSGCAAVSNGGKLYIGGTARIVNNTLSNTLPSDVWAYNGKMVYIGDGTAMDVEPAGYIVKKPEPGFKVGLRLENPADLSGNCEQGMEKYFFSNNPNYYVAYENGKVVLKEIGTEKRAVRTSESEHGVIYVDKQAATPEEEVTFTLLPDKKCEIVGEVTILSADGTQLDQQPDITEISDNTYKFTMPNSSVKIDATFEKMSDWRLLQKATRGDKEVSGEGAFEISDVSANGKITRTIKLLQDITATSADSALVVESSANGGMEIVLDLNGHVLNRGLVKEDGTTISNNHGSVIEVAKGGELTIDDSDTDNPHDGFVDASGVWHLDADGHPTEGETAETIKGGIITGGTGRFYDGYHNGGGIFLHGKLTLDNGNITGNKTPDDGGGVYSEGTFVMNGGELLYNNCMNSDARGGGVYNVGGIFTMKDGVIRNNTAGAGGAGIVNFGSKARTDIKAGMILNNEVLKWSPDAGGTGIANYQGTLSLESDDKKEIVVTGNTSTVGCDNGAIAVFSGIINISGKVIIKDNYNDGKYYVPVVEANYSNSQNLSVKGQINITGPLTGSCINVTHVDGGYKNNTGVLTNGYSTYNLGAKVSDFFHYDGSDPKLYMDLNKEGENAGELEVKEVPDDYYAIQIPSVPHGVIISDKQIAKNRDLVTLTAIPDEGYDLASLKYSYGSTTEDTISDRKNTGCFRMPESDVRIDAEFMEASNWDMLTKSMAGEEQPTVDGAFTVSDDANGVREIVLQSDITAEDYDSSLVVAHNKKIILDLNGHVLNRGLISADGTMKKDTQGSVIEVPEGCELTINDSTPDTEHQGFVGGDDLWHLGEGSGEKFSVLGGTLTGGIGKYGEPAPASRGGGAIFNKGKLTLNDVNIIGNSANRDLAGGGGGICNNSILVINGGLIRNNITDGSGGGIFTYDLDREIKTVLNNVTITDNIAAYGGGVFSDDSVLVSGGEICNNVALDMGGGLNIEHRTNYVKFYLGGDVVIDNNIANGRPNNFNSKTKEPIIVIGDGSKVDNQYELAAPKNGMLVGVTLQEYNKEAYTPIVGRITNSGDIPGYEKYFFADADNQCISYNNEGNYIEVKNIEESHKINSSSLENGKIYIEPQAASAGAEVTVTVVPNSGYRPDGLPVILSADGNPLDPQPEITKISKTEFKFTMPDQAVKIDMNFIEKQQVLNDTDMKLSEIVVEGWSVAETKKKLLLYYKNPENDNKFEIYENVNYFFSNNQGEWLGDDYIFKANEQVNIVMVIKAPEDRYYGHCYRAGKENVFSPDGASPIRFDGIQINIRQYKNGPEPSSDNWLYTGCEVGTGVEEDGITLKLDGFNKDKYIETDVAQRASLEKELNYIKIGGVIGVASQWEVFGEQDIEEKIPTPDMGGFSLRCRRLYRKYFTTEYLQDLVWKKTLNHNITAADKDNGPIQETLPYDREQRTTYIIDLNGHIIDRNYSNKEADTEGGKNLITINNDGKILIKDSSEAKTGKITGANTVGSGTSINEGTLIMNGGAITGNKGVAYTDPNKKYYAGGIVNKDSLYLGGVARVENNTAEGKTCNVKCMSGSKIYIGDGTSMDAAPAGEVVEKPREGFRVGISMQNPPGKFTENGTSADAKYFFSDDPNYYVAYCSADGGHLELKEIQPLKEEIRKKVSEDAEVAKENLKKWFETSGSSISDNAQEEILKAIDKIFASADAAIASADSKEEIDAAQELLEDKLDAINEIIEQGGDNPSPGVQEEIRKAIEEILKAKTPEDVENAKQQGQEDIQETQNEELEDAKKKAKEDIESSADASKDKLNAWFEASGSSVSDNAKEEILQAIDIILASADATIASADSQEEIDAAQELLKDKLDAIEELIEEAGSNPSPGVQEELKRAIDEILKAKTPDEVEQTKKKGQEDIQKTKEKEQKELEEAKKQAREDISSDANETKNKIKIKLETSGSSVSDNAKEEILQAIDKLLASADAAIVSAESKEEIDAAQELLEDKLDAINEIIEQGGDNPSPAVQEEIRKAIDEILKAKTPEDVENAKKAGVDAIDKAKNPYNPGPSPTPDPTTDSEQTEEEQKSADETISTLLLNGWIPDRKTIKINWNMIDGVAKYELYASKNENKLKLLDTIDNINQTSYYVKKISGKKIKPHKLYKIRLVAVKKDGSKIQSKIIKIVSARTMGKYANLKSITPKVEEMELRKGTIKHIGAKYKVYKNKKRLPKKYGNIFTYISDNPKVAKIDNQGFVVTLNPGTANIYIQELGGKFCTTKIIVK